jgi:hypothetical protein
MALKQDHSDLPAAQGSKPKGRKPDASPTFLKPYLDHLVAAHEAAGERPHAIGGTRFRHSMAGACSRQVAYHALGVPASNPMDLAGILVTGNGTAKHDEIQAVLVELLGDYFRPEVAVKVEGLDGSGSADGEFQWFADNGPVDGDAGPLTCWEHKNVGGFAFKMAIGERGEARGPKHDHIVQGALNALAMGADLLVITYLTWEAISVQAAKRKKIDEAGRVCAQWTFTRDEWEPLALAEVERVTKILACLDGGELPARVIPDPELPAGHRMTHPPTGGWEVRGEEGEILDAGEWWACGYCRWRDTCAQTATGRQPIVDVAVTLGLAPEGEAA